MSFSSARPAAPTASPTARRMPLLPVLTGRRWLDLCRHIGATSTCRAAAA